MDDRPLHQRIKSYVAKLSLEERLEGYLDCLYEKYPSLKKSHVTAIVKRIIALINYSINDMGNGTIAEIKGIVIKLKNLVYRCYTSEAEVTPSKQSRGKWDISNLFKLYAGKDLEAIRALTSSSLQDTELQPYIVLVDEVIRTHVELVANSIENALPTSVKGQGLTEAIEANPDKFNILAANSSLCRDLYRRSPVLKKHYIIKVAQEIVDTTLCAIRCGSNCSLENLERNIKNLRGVASGEIKDETNILRLTSGEADLSIIRLAKMYGGRSKHTIRWAISLRLRKDEEIILYVPIIDEVIQAQVKLITHSVEEIFPAIKPPCTKKSSKTKNNRAVRFAAKEDNRGQSLQLMSVMSRYSDRINRILWRTYQYIPEEKVKSYIEEESDDYLECLYGDYASLEQEHIETIVREILWLFYRLLCLYEHQSVSDIKITINNLRNIVAQKYQKASDIMPLTMFGTQEEMVILFKLYASRDLDYIRIKTCILLTGEDIKPYTYLIDQVISTQIELITNSIENALPASAKGQSLIEMMEVHPEQFSILSANKRYCTVLHTQYPTLDKRYISRIARKIVDLTFCAIEYRASLYLTDLDAYVILLRNIVSVDGGYEIEPAHQTIAKLIQLYGGKDIDYIRHETSSTLKGDAIMSYLPLIDKIICAQIELITNSTEKFLSLIQLPITEPVQEPPQPQCHTGKTVRFALKQDKSKKSSKSKEKNLAVPKVDKGYQYRKHYRLNKSYQ